MTDVRAPLAWHSAGIAAKICSSTKAQPSQSWTEVKDAPSSIERIMFQKPHAIAAPSSRLTRDPFTPSGQPGAAGQPGSLQGAAARGRWGSNPMGPPSRVRAARLRPSPNPSPTVTAGTGLRPFKHIICARMAVKPLRHHAPCLQSTHACLQRIVLCTHASVIRYERNGRKLIFSWSWMENFGILVVLR